MLNVPDQVAAYCSQRKLLVVDLLGAGKDGTVFATNVGHAVKFHTVGESYQRERDVYLRLLDREIIEICGLRVPMLVNYDDNLLIIEMTTVTPPYLLDFASAWLDRAPDFPRK